MAEVTPEAVWSSKTLQDILHVAFQSDDRPSGYALLDGFTEQISQEAPLGKSNFEAALVEAISSQKEVSTYLHRCWGRARREFDAQPQVASNQWRVDLISEAADLCLSYLAINGMHEDIFPDSIKQSEKLLVCLLEERLCLHENAKDLVTALLKKYTDDKERESIFLPTVLELMALLQHTSLVENWRPLVQTLDLLASYEVIATMMISAECWLPDGCNGNQIEAKSLLGSVFALSPAHVLPSSPPSSPLQLLLLVPSLSYSPNSPSSSSSVFNAFVLTTLPGLQAGRIICRAYQESLGHADGNPTQFLYRSLPTT
eukprot:NODE_618_length_2044_cov_24.710777_g571_i0.p1 GENE.NODE_618_length_2044_cov_24.710777_g571_i0~~NODE_618_length_2044_cov_24.710777_g571_i0.p1  ORF type:complete len:315 (+),score=56.81 NODE_618_length_2044_cov_24.710777_g571_i0:124-1068(+)